MILTAFWGWPSRLWARKSMLKCSTVDCRPVFVVSILREFLNSLKVWELVCRYLWVMTWVMTMFWPISFTLQISISIPSIETSAATRCRMIKASPFGLFGRLSLATSMRVAWSRKGVSGCVSSQLWWCGSEHHLAWHEDGWAGTIWFPLISIYRSSVPRVNIDPHKTPPKTCSK